jgi:hypothetical protein
MQLTRLKASLLACASIFLAGSGLLAPANAEQQTAPATTSARLPATLSGKVTDVKSAMGYTYAEVDTGQGKVWAAGPSTALKAGDTVSFPTVMPMRNFHSKSLNRDFDVLYFISAFENGKGEPIGGEGQADISSQKPAAKPAAAPIATIETLENGQSIAHIHANKDALKQKTVRVRGQVTKFNAGILGKNWLHIRDNSSSDDLTVTTDGMSALGDVVIVEGQLQLDKDFGYGYRYPLIVENATITKE